VFLKLRLPWKKSFVILCVLAAGGVGGQPIKAQEIQDVVYLQDGSIIRGTIVEQVPGESILIQTVDGNRFRYNMEEIERMTRETQPGQGTSQARPQSAKSPGTAALLSVLIIGGGQGYNGEWGKAAAFFGGGLVAGAATLEALASDECFYGDDCAAAGGWALGYIAIAVWSIVDAHKSAKAINARLAVAGLEFMPRPGLRVANTPFGSRAQLDVQLLRWTR
jgi:hypothetical protein